MFVNSMIEGMAHPKTITIDESVVQLLQPVDAIALSSRSHRHSSAFRAATLVSEPVASDECSSHLRFAASAPRALRRRVGLGSSRRHHQPFLLLSFAGRAALDVSCPPAGGHPRSAE